MNMIKEKIGNRIKELRILRLCLNQEEFARKIGWDKTYLSSVNHGLILYKNHGQFCTFN